jgi:hypothetical protein
VTWVIAGHSNPVTVVNGSVAATFSLVILARLWVGARSPRASWVTGGVFGSTWQAGRRNQAQGAEPAAPAA